MHLEADYRSDEIEEAKVLENARRSFRKTVAALKDLAAAARSDFPGKDKLSVRRRRSALLRKVETHPLAVKHAETFALPERRGAAFNLIRDVAGGYKPLRKSYPALDTQARNKFRTDSLAVSRKPLAEVLPEELLAFLPEKLVVEVDPKGTVTKITSRFGNKIKDWEQKIARQAELVKDYNKIVRRVKKDLRSPNEKVRLAALLTSIIMETGIRPGYHGMQTMVRDPDTGEKVAVETFGAVTLGPQHVNFVRDNFTGLTFQGKQNSTNIAMISNRAVIKVLQDYVEKAQKSGSKHIFVSKDGKPFTASMLSGYLSRTFGKIDPTDFRKLKATQSFLDDLRDQEEQMFQEILDSAEEQEELLKERVVAALVNAITRAQDTAALSLSHGSGKDVTVGSYINPVVLLDFFSRGKAAASLKQAVLNKKPVLAFNPKTFVELAAAGSRWASGETFNGLLLRLQELMEDS